MKSATLLALSLVTPALLATTPVSAQTVSPTRPQATTPAQPSSPTPAQPTSPAPAQPAAPEPMQTAQDLFTQLDLFGSYAINCQRNPGPRNPYTVFEPSDDANVQIDLMVGNSREHTAYTIDMAMLTDAQELVISMTNEEVRLDVVYQMRNNRLRIMESVRSDGEQIITGGRSVASGVATQWFNKCG
jgi:hypothetical protein